MNRINIETGVGILLVAGLLCLAYLSVKLGDVNLTGSRQYPVIARFASITGLNEGASVEIAGVAVGKVSRISLDNYEAVVEMMIDRGVDIQEDAIATIRTQGIIGDKYVKIVPGGAEEHIKAGGEMLETESAIELEELVSKYIFEKE